MTGRAWDFSVDSPARDVAGEVHFIYASVDRSSAASLEPRALLRLTGRIAKSGVS